MDLRIYYQKIREIEAMLPASDVVVVSCETPDGGKAGVRTEVARQDAARLIVEGRARLATEEEAAEYREELRQASERAQEAARLRQIRVAIVPEEEAKSRRSTKGDR